MITKEYLAGFIDGEGYIKLMPRKSYDYNPIIAITNTNLQVLKEIKDYIGFGSINPMKRYKSNHKQAWIYILAGGINIYKLLKSILSYLIVKKKEAEKVIAFIENKPYYKVRLEIGEIINLKKRNVSNFEIAKIIGVSRRTIVRHLKKELGKEEYKNLRIYFKGCPKAPKRKKLNE